MDNRITFNNKLVDWNCDNGIAVGMIGDLNRNQFYDRVLKEVADRRCVDIGFGTGLLSFLAIKHGAKHVTAFESNTERYRLGIRLIEKMNLQDRITLVNARFSADKLTDQELIFQEIFDQEFWADGLAYCAVDHDLPILPSKYMCEFYLAVIDDELYNRLTAIQPNISSLFVSEAVTQSIKEQNNNWQAFYNCVKGNNWPETPPKDIKQLPQWIQDEITEMGYKDTLDSYHTVDIGVEFSNSDSYLEEINHLINSQIKNKIQTLYNINESIINRQQYIQLINNGVKLADYQFDYLSNTVTVNDFRGRSVNILDRSQMYIDLILDKNLFANQNYILLPITTVGHGDSELILPPVTEEIDIHKFAGTRFYAKTAWGLPIHNLIFAQPNFNNSQALYARQYIDNGILRIYDDN